MRTADTVLAEASAVHKGAVARAAIHNETDRAAPIQSERAVALGHRQRGQIDLVLRVPTDPDGAAPSQEHCFLRGDKPLAASSWQNSGGIFRGAKT